MLNTQFYYNSFHYTHSYKQDMAYCHIKLQVNAAIVNNKLIDKQLTKLSFLIHYEITSCFAALWMIFNLYKVQTWERVPSELGFMLPPTNCEMLLGIVSIIKPPFHNCVVKWRDLYRCSIHEVQYLNQASHHEGTQGSGDIDPHILNIDTTRR
jgi:hypothetical protein